MPDFHLVLHPSVFWQLSTGACEFWFVRTLHLAEGLTSCLEESFGNLYVERFSHLSCSLLCPREGSQEITFKNILLETSWQQKRFFVYYLQRSVEGTQGFTRQCKAPGTVSKEVFLTFC